MFEVVVHPRIHEKHPELKDEDVESAFRNIFSQALRSLEEREEYMAIGSDSNGRLIEIVYRSDPEGNVIIYHAFTPPTKKALAELGRKGKYDGQRRNKQKAGDDRSGNGRIGKCVRK